MRSVLERAGGCAGSSSQGTPNNPRRDSGHESKLDVGYSAVENAQSSRLPATVLMISDDSQTSA